jgi:hypothetical protein
MSATPSVNTAGTPGDYVSDEDMRAVMRTTIQKAKEGDVACIRMVVRLYARQDRPVRLDLPRIVDAESLAEAQAIVIAETAKGDKLTPRQGHAFSTMLEYRRRAMEVVEQQKRLDSFEERQRRADANKDGRKIRYMQT